MGVHKGRVTYMLQKAMPAEHLGPSSSSFLETAQAEPLPWITDAVTWQRQIRE